MIAVSFSPSASSTASNTLRAAAKLSPRALPMPTAWLPWPGKTNAIDIATPLKRRRFKTTAPPIVSSYGERLTLGNFWTTFGWDTVCRHCFGNISQGHGSSGNHRRGHRAIARRSAIQAGAARQGARAIARRPLPAAARRRGRQPGACAPSARRRDDGGASRGSDSRDRRQTRRQRTLNKTLCRRRSLADPPGAHELARQCAGMLATLEDRLARDQRRLVAGDALHETPPVRRH